MDSEYAHGWEDAARWVLWLIGQGATVREIGDRLGEKLAVAS